MTTPDDSGTDPEIKRLRAEVEHLRSELERAEAPSPPERAGESAGRTGWWRTVVVIVLVALGALIAPLAVVATWAHDQVGDTDRYVETVAPLIADPAVQAALIDRVTEVIVEQLSVDEVTGEALDALAQQDFVPPRAAPLLPALAVPLSNAVENFIHQTVGRLVRSDTFEQAWVTANREAHGQAVTVLTGEGTSQVSTAEGEVSVNVAAFVDAAKELLIERGFGLAERIPTVNATFVVFQSDDLGRAQTWFSWLETAARALPILGLIVLAAAVLIARDRRRALLAVGLSVAAAMVLLGLALNIVRPLYLEAVPDDVLPTAAAAAVYDQLVLFIRTALRAVLVIALALAITAFLLAKSGAGAAIRTGITGGLAGLRERSGVSRGPVSTFVATYRTFVRVAVVGVAALAYVSLEHPTGTSALVIVVLVVVALVAVELVGGRRPERRRDAAPTDA